MTKKIAAIVSVYRRLSHAQHIVDRFLRGYQIRGKHHRPAIEVVSLYVDQFPENDLSRSRSEEFNFKIYPTIPEAICNSCEDLAVDGILLIAEHGDYPRNEKGQTLYPRYKFFKEIIDVFDRSGKSCPIFCDKHLSYDFTKAKDIINDRDRIGFPMLAGSSIPVTFRLPPIDVPLGSEVSEAIAIGFGDLDILGFHALEGLQCMIERRRGGETGVKSLRYLGGDSVWDAIENGEIAKDLVASAISRSDSPQGNAMLDGRPEDLFGLGYLPNLVQNPEAIQIEHNDGLISTLLMLSGAVADFLFACRIGSEIISTQFFLPPEPNVNYFSCLVDPIEQMFLTGEVDYSADRTLFTSGVLDVAIDARHRKIEKIETPNLSDLNYKIEKS